MGSTYTPLKIDLSEATLQRCLGATVNLSVRANAPCRVASGELVGDDDASALAAAIEALLCTQGLQGMTVRVWHVLCAERLREPAAHVRDMTSIDTTSVACVLLCVGGEGMLSLAPPSEKEKPTLKMNKIHLQQHHCVVYKCNVTYAIHQSPATYFHFVCARGDTAVDVAVHQGIRFPCPYNKTAELGDVRAYHRSYDPFSTGECHYRGAKWKNVLDHLMNCKANTDVDRCTASQAKRRTRNKKKVWCALCDHPGFGKQNTLVQHMRRHHPNAKDILPLEAGSASGDDSGLDDLAWLSNLAAQLPLEAGCDGSPLPKNSKLRRRRDNTTAPGVKGVSMLQQFDMCLSSLSESESPVLLTEVSVEETSGRSDLLQPESNVSDVSVPLTKTQAYEMVTSMLGSISKAAIRQPAGRMEQNASEMSLDGVTAILSAFGDIQPGDVFADVGSGVGNVAIQVALQTPVAKSIAIEMREELTALTTTIVADHMANEPRLAKLVVIEADISQIDFADLPHMIDVTHVFSHNTLFEPKAILKLETVCLMPKLRRIALSLLPCSRHSERCEKWFCRLWTLEKTIRVPVTYKDGWVDIFIFSREKSFV